MFVLRRNNLPHNHPEANLHLMIYCVSDARVQCPFRIHLNFMKGDKGL